LGWLTTCWGTVVLVVDEGGVVLVADGDGAGVEGALVVGRTGPAEVFVALVLGAVVLVAGLRLVVVVVVAGRHVVVEARGGTVAAVDAVAADGLRTVDMSELPKATVPADTSARRTHLAPATPHGALRTEPPIRVTLPTRMASDLSPNFAGRRTTHCTHAAQ
jgi:hypothetical protein